MKPLSHPSLSLRAIDSQIILFSTMSFYTQEIIVDIINTISDILISLTYNRNIFNGGSRWNWITNVLSDTNLHPHYSHSKNSLFNYQRTFSRWSHYITNWLRLSTKNFLLFQDSFNLIDNKNNIKISFYCQEVFSSFLKFLVSRSISLLMSSAA